jgi:hypothetical protein
MAKWYVSAKKADFAAIGAKFGIDHAIGILVHHINIKNLRCLEDIGDFVAVFLAKERK